MDANFGRSDGRAHVVLFRTAVIVDVDCRCLDVGFETSADEAVGIRYLL
jgi:hypothetical protein